MTYTPTMFYTCKICGGTIYQSRITGGVPYDPERIDHLVHLDFADWRDNIHQAVIAPDSGREYTNR
jgi:hypothetical protein